jgi:hypothetical protein
MKKLIYTVLFMICSIANTYSQDVITKKNSEDILAKVVEVTNSEIKYKRFDNQNGPLFTISKSEVLMVRYENGTKDVFTNETKPVNQSSNVSASDEMKTKGRQDAMVQYRGRNSGATWTGVTTILFTPVIGIIPAVGCTNTEPQDKNLDYTNSELMKDNSYNLSYREQAHKMKKKKVWTNYGLSSAAWLILILVL